jgi:dTDP-4-dehydrorhamnose reductase
MALGLLVTGVRSPLAQSLFTALQQWAPAIDVQMLDETQAQRATCVLNLAILHDDRQHIIADSKTASAWCQQMSCPLIHLSSYRVFSADKKNVHNEKDHPNALPDDQYLVQLEEDVSALENSIILRTSWLIGASGTNLLTRLLQAFLNGSKVDVHRRLRGAPTTTDDLARVVVALTKQISCAAENWGVMHYCSSDHCSEEEFAEQVLQYLIQHQLLTAEPSLQLIGGEDDEPMASAILGCRRLRDGFGIQPRSWRPNLLSIIKNWLSHRNSTDI